MTKAQLKTLESRRRELQTSLDAAKTSAERNEMGQFATPHPLAEAIVAETLKMTRGRVRFLEPSIGTGVFYSALLSKIGRRNIESAVGFDIDPHYGKPAKKLWDPTALDYRITDFTRANPERHFNLLVANPPYVRHHHLEGDEKIRLGNAVRAMGVDLSGLAGLYCHFLILSHRWMEAGGVGAWLIPSEFMDTNYGHEIRRWLLQDVTLERIHRFDPNDVQFGDALVSSSVVFIRHALPAEGHRVRFTFGGTIETPAVSRLVAPNVLRQEHKWSRFPAMAERNNAHTLPRLRDFFHVKRGLATGANNVFILTQERAFEEGIPAEMLRPILPSPKYLNGDVVTADCDGIPHVDRRLFLLDCRLEPSVLERRFPRVWSYLERHRKSLGDAYLLKHRDVWYLQENRPPAPILCTYMGRSDGDAPNPFRFILNLSQATAANSYHMLYPKGGWAAGATPATFEMIWNLLRNLDATTLLEEGRVYGGGLHKVEPKELANIAVPGMTNLVGQGHLALG